MRFPHVRVDIEPTNRCNASCSFCPRDMTPHVGLMSQDVFSAALAHTERLKELVTTELDLTLGVSLCGLGEPLINPLTPQWIRELRAADLEVSVTSNGALLDQERGDELLEAGLSEIMINVGEQGDDYEEVYGLPWERTRERVVRFAADARDRCNVTIVLVDHRSDPSHIEAQKGFWRGHGLSRFVSYEVMNRGGSLFVDHMQFADYPEQARATSMFAERGGTPPCLAPFVFPFVGYDGYYYLCCSDWKKEAATGHVFEHSFADAIAAKLDHVSTRRAPCETCNIDPLNRLTSELRASSEDLVLEEPPDVLADKLVGWGHQVGEIADVLSAVATNPSPRSQTPTPGPEAESTAGVARRRSITLSPRR